MVEQLTQLTLHRDSGLSQSSPVSREKKCFAFVLFKDGDEPVPWQVAVLSQTEPHGDHLRARQI